MILFARLTFCCALFSFSPIQFAGLRSRPKTSKPDGGVAASPAAASSSADAGASPSASGPEDSEGEATTQD